MTNRRNYMRRFSFFLCLITAAVVALTFADNTYLFASVSRIKSIEWSDASSTVFRDQLPLGNPGLRTNTSATQASATVTLQFRKQLIHSSDIYFRDRRGTGLPFPLFAFTVSAFLDTRYVIYGAKPQLLLQAVVRSGPLPVPFARCVYVSLGDRACPGTWAKTITRDMISFSPASVHVHSDVHGLPYFAVSVRCEAELAQRPLMAPQCRDQHKDAYRKKKATAQPTEEHNQNAIRNTIFGKSQYEAYFSLPTHVMLVPYSADPLSMSYLAPDMANISSIADAWTPILIPDNAPLPPISSVDATKYYYNTSGELNQNRTVDSSYLKTAICTPALYGGDAHAHTLRSWMLVNKSMGISKIFIYNVTSGSEIDKILHHFKDIVQVLQWRFHPDMHKLPEGISHRKSNSQLLLENDQKEWDFTTVPRKRTIVREGDVLVHNYGQLAAIHDCMSRTIGQYRWVGYIDLDEYIISRTASIWKLSEIIEEAAKPHNSYYHKNINSNVDLVVHNSFINSTHNDQIQLSLKLGSSVQAKHSIGYYFQNTFVCAHCNQPSLKHIMVHNKDLSKPFPTISPILNLSYHAQLPPFLYSALRSQKFFKAGERSKVVLDPLAVFQLTVHGIYRSFASEIMRINQKNIKTNMPTGITLKVIKTHLDFMQFFECDKLALWFKEKTSNISPLPFLEPYEFCQNIYSVRESIPSGIGMTFPKTIVNTLSALHHSRNLKWNSSESPSILLRINCNQKCWKHNIVEDWTLINLWGNKWLQYISSPVSE